MVLFIAMTAMTLSGGQDRGGKEGIKDRFVGAWRLVWSRSKRDRSLITVAALIALNRPEQLRSHLQRARANGVTKDEVVEAITHLAFYTG